MTDYDTLLEDLQYQVALFARRAEQSRIGGVDQRRGVMDRAAFLLLHRLDGEGPLGVKALAAAMGIDSSTVTRQVAPLVDQGLVRRVPNPDDGRAVVLALTPAGRLRLEEVRTSRRALLTELTEGWTRDEQEHFAELLTRLNLRLRQRQLGYPQGDAPQDAPPATHEPAAADESDESDERPAPAAAG
ncbi:MarR family transcriptional regulator [Mangrovactinospora gilvigrisea]|uniref:MarR family transcriptional regulator n=1 Tax=Mangrovactinospora gilvigrisea TaxID=1428644 RepID=A0A1J7BZB7_9ACTN|nr:MarR family transcriptional regulator [Mangrovactinospora gilvigrisea]OIV38825.1 MarR family transcriptional regulator [Mangrovactinospora gilvigrisea]